MDIESGNLSVFREAYFIIIEIVRICYCEYNCFDHYPISSSGQIIGVILGSIFGSIFLVSMIVAIVICFQNRRRANTGYVVRNLRQILNTTTLRPPLQGQQHHHQPPPQYGAIPPPPYEERAADGMVGN
ncbi:hypothetical protein AC249_AIPGENE4268 [Exaiptasia diaphana]|nr:hypothetical protein AC249_AIPGENE4268 [Exaiptasia diaphana]